MTHRQPWLDRPHEYPPHAKGQYDPFERPIPVYFWHGEANLQGVGELLAGDGPTVALAGAGALQSAGYATIFDDSSSAGTGTLAAAGTITLPGIAALSGAGVLTCSADSGSAALAGTGSLTAAGLLVSLTSAGLTGAGTAAANGIPSILGSAAISGTGVLQGVPQEGSGVSFAGAGAAAEGVSAQIAPALPAGIAAGDFMLCVAMLRRRDSVSITTPAGWTLLSNHAHSSSTALRVFLFTRFYQAGDVAPPLAPTGSIGADTVIFAQVHAFRGVHTSLPYATALTWTDSALRSFSIGPITGLTTAASNSMVLVGGIRLDDSTALANIASTLSGDGLNWAEAAEAEATVNANAFMVLDYAATPDAGTVIGNKTFTIAPTTTDTSWSGFTIELARGGAVTYQGAAALQGAGSLAASVAFDAPLIGTGSLQAVATRSTFAVAALAGSGQLLATPVGAPTSSDYARRIGLRDVRMHTDFPDRASVDDYMQIEGDYAAHPEWGRWIGPGDPLAAMIPPGQTGCLYINVDPMAGEHDTRNALPWQPFQSYTLDSAVYNPVNGHYFGCRQAHGSSQTPYNGPDNSSDGGSNAYWQDYGGVGTFYDDPHVTWLRRYDDSWGDFDGFRDGDQFWLIQNVLIEQYFADSHWEVNGPVGNASGNKFYIMHRWNRANTLGQLVSENNNFRDHLTGYIHDASGYPMHSWTGNLAQYGLGGSEIVWQNAIVPRTAAEISSRLRMWRQHNRWTSEHPSGLDPVFAYANPVSPTSAELARRGRRQTGGLYSQRGAWGTGSTQPQSSDPESGGIKVRRDMAGKRCDIMDHVVIGNFGQPNSYRETYIGLPGKPWKLKEVVENINFELDTDGYSTGPVNAAYGNPGFLDAPPGGWPQSAVQLMLQMSSRARNTHSHPSGTHQQSGTFWNHLVCRSGPEGFAEQGLTLPQPSRVTKPSYIPITGGQIRRMATARNGFTTADSVIPAEIRGGINGGNGRNIMAYSGIIFHPYKPHFYIHRASGHGAAFNNDTYHGDMTGTSQMEGFDREDGSALADYPIYPDTTDFYADGRPAGIHAYSAQGMTLDERLWQSGGLRNFDGHNVSYLSSYQLGSKAATGYTHYDTTGHLPYGPGSGMGISQRFNRLVIWHADDGYLALFDPDNEVWRLSMFNTGSVDNGGNGPGYVYDHSRDQLLTVGRADNSHKRVTMTSANSVSVANITYTGTYAAEVNALDTPSAVYDEWRDRIWLVNTGLRGTDYSQYLRYLYEIDPATLAINNRYTLGGDTPDRTYYGTQYLDIMPVGSHRAGILPYWDALVVYGRSNDVPYVVSLP